MKNKITIVFAFFFLVASATVFAQGKGKGPGNGNNGHKNEQPGKSGPNPPKGNFPKGGKHVNVPKPGGKGVPGNFPKKPGKAFSNGNGHAYAYGHNKGNMHGWDFGYLRSAPARAQIIIVLDDARFRLDEMNVRVITMQDRIEAARMSNEAKFRANSIPRAIYEANQQRIRRAEEMVAVADARVRAERSNVDDATSRIPGK